MLKDYITCYHGTINIFSEYISMSGIDLSKSRAATDFGKGFYVTNNKGQAIDWAKKKSRDFRKGSNDESKPVVLQFNIDTTSLSSLNHCLFEEPNLDWSNFILCCRERGLKGYVYHHFDFVLGPLADGKIMPLVRRALNGRINNIEFLEGIKPNSDNNTQLALHTEAALNYINLTEVETIEVE